jgi:aminoglycoside phosphotransferase (APT) family kinase protein
MRFTTIIDAVPDRAALDRLIAKAFHSAEVESVETGGWGNIGFVHRVQISREPRTVIVKWQKYEGIAAKEARQLELLRKHASVPVPEVYYAHPGSEDLPYEAVVMECLPGVQASHIDPPPVPIQQRLAEDVIDALMTWHAVENPEGYGSIGGPYHRRWVDSYKGLLLKAQDELHNGPLSKGVLPEYVVEVADRSIEAMESIFGHIEGSPVLIHGDIWLPNVLIDPETFKITGILDPIGARWADRELDFAPMWWPWEGGGDYLMNCYTRRVTIPDGFDLRRRFYGFWFRLLAFASIGWPMGDGAPTEAAELHQAMEEQLG